MNAVTAVAQRTAAMATRTLAWILCVLGASACATTTPPTSHARARAPVVAARSVYDVPRDEAPAPTLSEADQAREAAAIQRDITSMRWDVQRRLERARTRDDLGEFRCLDGRLSELDASLRMFAEQRERFDVAYQSGDAEHRAQSFRRMMALRRHSSDVGDDARRCATGGDAVDGTQTSMVFEGTR